MTSVLQTPSVSVNEVFDIDALESLSLEWLNLWKRCSTATPFQTPQWILPWWRNFGGDNLRAITLRHEKELIGLAPLFIYRDPSTKTRQLLLIGTGVTDYLDVLLADAWLDDGLTALARYITDQWDQWDVCDFQELQQGSALLKLDDLCGYSGQKTVQNFCPVLQLPPQVDVLSQITSRGLFEELHHKRAKLERMGKVDFETANQDNWYSFFDKFLSLHSSRWAMLGLPGVMADATVQNFHREVIPGMLSQGLLRLFVLKLDDRTLAAYYGFFDRGRAYYYLSGFEPELAKLSPGMLIVNYAMREAIREGAFEFDFLRGQEKYKYRWMVQDRPNYRYRLCR
ncbi:MAG TPA: GNAT family N-acetyltransferase [Blastocatellia bacterium]|nr:GNAT family N-acetyltransferase [Blastocatellia bacterium]